MIQNKHKSDCCGCTACSAICPVGAITMKPDLEGFLYPEVNEDACIRCGLCQRVCPFKEDYSRADKADEGMYLAFVHSDADVRKKSRSGGGFFALAKLIIERGGVVFGVCLDQDLKARHVRVDSLEGLRSLQGSKYVQSDKGDSFALVKRNLEANIPVLFSGTGCEVSALHSYLEQTKTDTSLLYTCDLICHGVPSPRVWSDNVSSIQKKLGGKPDSLSFRDKRFGWSSHIESYTKGNKTVFSNRYTALFYSHNILRPSCANCKWCNYERSGDITIADFWGVERLGLGLDLSEGITAMMANSEKGKELARSALGSARTVFVKKEDISQPNLFAPSHIPATHDTFWKDYQTHGFDKTAKKYYGIKPRLSLIYNLVYRRKRT